MDRTSSLLLGFVVVASGCIGGQSNSGEFLSKYDTDVLQLERQGQRTKFMLDKNSQGYRVRIFSPRPAEEMFSDTENRTQSLGQVCGSLQERMYKLGLNQGVGGQKTFNILNRDGELLESQREVNMTEFADVLKKYELTEVIYSVSSQSGDKVADCSIESKQPDGLKLRFYDNR